MNLTEIGWGGGCRMDSPGSGYRPMAGCGECGDDPLGSGAKDFVRRFHEGGFESTSVL
jgi:hypothetical protein